MQKLKICKRCVMDDSIEDITFDDSGYCNYCNELILKLSQNRVHNNTKSLYNLINKIKEEGKNKKYDCIVGLSGGVDSATVLIKSIELGLRPLAVHMDNGWNSELAQSNIFNLVKKLGVDFETYVIDWNEYKELMLGFLDSDILDIELLYDNAYLAVNYLFAKKYNIKYILGGFNISTEGMRMPSSWNWYKLDKRQIKFISKKYRKKGLKSFPALGTFQLLKYKYINGIKWESILDKMEYLKEDSLRHLTKNFNFKPYPYKHYESIFTRFYQGYILPKKFNIDKRKLHFSTLIITNQMSQEKAISNLKSIPYPSEKDLEKDLKYFLKKLNMTSKEFKLYLKRPGRDHSNLPTEKYIIQKIRKVLPQNFIKKIKSLLSKSK